MKRSTTILAATLSLAGLAACAGSSQGTVITGSTATTYSRGYYDGHYGPFQKGYWASDGHFYYQTEDGRWHRDTERHFRREAEDGYHLFYSRAVAGNPMGSSGA